MDDFTKYNKTEAIREDERLVQDRTIAALFFDESEAKQAKQALEDEGYEHIDLTKNVESAADGKPAHEHSFWDSVKSFFGGDDDTHTYAEGVRRGNTLLTLHTEQGRASNAVEILERFDPIDIDGAEQAWRGEGWSTEQSKADAYAYDRDRLVSDDNKAQDVIPVVEENLVVGKREVEGGNVRVRSYVREIPVSDQVSLRQENINVDRRPVDRPVTDADAAFQDRTIDVTATNEEAVVGKTARVVEEVAVSKDVSQRTETVNDTVRKTEVEVDGDQSDRFNR